MELSEEEQESFTEVTDYFKTGTEAQKQVILKAAKLLLNILEDAYIEARICDRYTGRFATGIHLNNIRFTEMMPSVTEQLINGCYRFSVFCNLLNQYCRSGDINNRDGYAGELLDLFYDVLPLVDDAIYDEEMKRRCYAVNRILLMVWAYIKEIAEKAEEEENTSEEPSDTIELTGKQQYNSRGISVQTLCESCYSLRIELHRKRVQRPVAQLGMRYSGEQL